MSRGLLLVLFIHLLDVLNYRFLLLAAFRYGAFRVYKSFFFKKARKKFYQCLTLRICYLTWELVDLFFILGFETFENIQRTSRTKIAEHFIGKRIRKAW